ncbi:hypothetical protein KCU89_g1487, partial [Aureobasidium melanogenum]
MSDSHRAISVADGARTVFKDDMAPLYPRSSFYRTTNLLMAQHTVKDDNKGLKVLVDRESQIALDIVFVHGLRGHRINTWSSNNKNNNVCWPKDLLSEDIKDARILTFGYDAQVAGFLSETSQASIFAHAEKLLDNLKNARRGVESRPIIFIGHSLGGIIIKDALIRSSECKHSKQDVRLGAIFDATIGVIFMATPHRGSRTASLAQYAVTAAKIALQNPNRHIIDALKVDSQILEKQRTSFGAIIEPSKLRCAYEELPTHTQLIVGAASAMIDGVISVAIEADHVSICKFVSRENTGYDTIRGWILDMRENDPAVARKFGISTIIRYDELVGFENDIQRMITEKINHMDLKEHFKDRLRSQLPNRAGHTFLLASLILATISKQKSLRLTDLNRLVRSEKPTDLYENALRSLSAHDRDRAFRLLKIVLVAAEAFTPGQLDMAECLNAEDRSLTTLDREGNPEDALRDVCGVLLCVLNGKVFIFHETVREYLSERDDFNPTEVPADYFASLPDAHQILADRCIWFLNLDTWNQFEVNEDIESSIREARAWLRWRMTNKTFWAEDIMFLEYAAKNWFRHVDMSMNIETRLINPGTVEGCLISSSPTEGSRRICDLRRSSTALWMMLADMSSSRPDEIARYGSPSLITSFFPFAIAPIDPDQIRSLEALAYGIVRYEQDLLWRLLVSQCLGSPQISQMLFNVACKRNWQTGVSLFQTCEVSVDPTEALRSTFGFLSTTTLQVLLDLGAVVDYRILSQATEQGNPKHMAILLESCDEKSQNALRPFLQDSLRISLSCGNFEFASVLRSFTDVNFNCHELADTWIHDRARDAELALGSRELELYHMFTDHSDGCKSWQTHWRNETYVGLQDLEYSEIALETMLLSSLLWPQHRSYGSRHRAMVQTILQMGAKLTMDDDRLQLLFELMCHTRWDDEDLVYFLLNIDGFASAILRGRTIEHLITTAVGKHYSTCDYILGRINESRQPNFNLLNYQGCSLLGAFISDHGGILDDSNHVLKVLRLGADPDLRTSSPLTKSNMIGHVGREVLKRWADEDSVSSAAMVVAGFIYKELESSGRVSHGYNPKNLPIQPPLVVACKKGNWAVAQALLKHEASPSVFWEPMVLAELFRVHEPSGPSMAPYSIISIEYHEYTLLRFLRLLQSCDLLAGYINHREQYSGSTLVHWIMLADDRDCDEFLNMEGVDFNIHNTCGDTPLHWYIYREKMKIRLAKSSRSQLVMNFDLTLKGSAGISFLDAIFKGGRSQDSENCFKSVKPSDLCSCGSFFLHKAIRAGARDWIDFFACIEDFDLNAQDDEGATALHLAVMLDDVATTLMLLSKAVRTDILDQKGKAAMHYAILGSRGIVRALTSSEGVDLEVLSRSNMTPLLEAFTYGAATDSMVTNVRLLVNALIARAHFDDRINLLDFVTNSIPYFQRTGEDLPELLKLVQSKWTPDPKSDLFTWNGSDSEDSDGMSSDEESAEE